MQFAFPGVLWVAAAAGLAAVAIHLLSWRRPEPRPLPTARFIPPSPQRALSRRFELSDALLLALRLIVIAAIALAVAGPKWVVKRSGIARVVIADRSRSVYELAEVRDSVIAASRGVAFARVIAFDSTAVILDGDMADSSRAQVRGSLDAALVLASREAASLRSRFDSVDVVVVSPMRSEELSSAAARILGEGGLQPLVMLVRHQEGASQTGGSGAGLPSPRDPIGASLRLALGAQAPSWLRVIRSEPQAADSAHAVSGGVLVIWPGAGGESLLADGILSASGATVINVSRGPVSEGKPVAWWRDGSVAATQESSGDGCIRRVALDVGAKGDVTLRPGFQRFARDMAKPCNWLDTTAAALPSPAFRSGVPRSLSESAALADASTTVQRLLLALALLCLAAELWVRRRIGRVSGSTAMEAALP